MSIREIRGRNSGEWGRRFVFHLLAAIFGNGRLWGRMCIVGGLIDIIINITKIGISNNFRYTILRGIGRVAFGLMKSTKNSIN